MTESIAAPSANDSTPVRVSLKAMLIVIAFIATGCALMMHYLELRKTQASLARYEASLIPTDLKPNEFRVIAKPVLQTDHAIVITYRIETKEDHFATIASGGDSGGARARFDAKTGLYVTDSVIFIDHIDSKNALKIMPKVSGAQGYSVYEVDDEFSLVDSMVIHELAPVNDRAETMELFQINGRNYALSLKP